MLNTKQPFLKFFSPQRTIQANGLSRNAFQSSWNCPRDTEHTNLLAIQCGTIGTSCAPRIMAVGTGYIQRRGCTQAPHRYLEMK